MNTPAANETKQGELERLAAENQRLREALGKCLRIVEAANIAGRAMYGCEVAVNARALLTKEGGSDEQAK